MLRNAIEGLHPAGWTDRRTFRLASLVWLAINAAAYAGYRYGSSGAELAGFAVLAIAFVVILLLTIRRLRDAGFSVFWAVLLFVPQGFGLRLSPDEPGSFYLLAEALSLVIKLAPIALGLAAPSRPAHERRI